MCPLRALRKGLLRPFVKQLGGGEDEGEGWVRMGTGFCWSGPVSSLQRLGDRMRAYLRQSGAQDGKTLAIYINVHPNRSYTRGRARQGSKTCEKGDLLSGERQDLTRANLAIRRRYGAKNGLSSRTVSQSLLSRILIREMRRT